MPTPVVSFLKRNRGVVRGNGTSGWSGGHSRDILYVRKKKEKKEFFSANLFVSTVIS